MQMWAKKETHHTPILDLIGCSSVWYRFDYKVYVDVGKERKTHHTPILDLTGSCFLPQVTDDYANTFL